MHSWHVRVDIRWQLVNGTVAMSIGYRVDVQSMKWDGSDVTDPFFKQFGNDPPDILGNEDSADWTDCLKYMRAKLGLDDDETGKREEELNTVIDALHGVEMSKIQRADASDHSFAKRELVAKWLHVFGGF